MSARDELYAVLRLAGESRAEAERLIAAHNAEVLRNFQMRDARELTARYRAEVLTEAADKLALELTPDGPSAGRGFLLALQMCMRTLRCMADEGMSTAQFARIEDARQTLQQNREQGGAQ
ncbi:hypothetical protein [Streptomyces sp. Wh19]|uniref:hypothetical protein n=1 Tax=Streptomyces sp. Wh19 TaxID=3076629 RepID=UPI0029589071|nr:hypothetical protein [Streptomyces sp. Wh19]MDV9194350.1 hypothetical protein [Streptomyces sp. Wh19]